MNINLYNQNYYRVTPVQNINKQEKFGKNKKDNNKRGNKEQKQAQENSFASVLGSILDKSS